MSSARSITVVIGEPVSPETGKAVVSSSSPASPRTVTRVTAASLRKRRGLCVCRVVGVVLLILFVGIFCAVLHTVLVAKNRIGGDNLLHNARMNVDLSHPSGQTKVHMSLANSQSPQSDSAPAQATQPYVSANGVGVKGVSCDIYTQRHGQPQRIASAEMEGDELKIVHALNDASVDTDDVSLSLDIDSGSFAWLSAKSLGATDNSTVPLDCHCSASVSLNVLGVAAFDFDLTGLSGQVDLDLGTLRSVLSRLISQHPVEAEVLPYGLYEVSATVPRVEYSVGSQHSLTIDSGEVVCDQHFQCTVQKESDNFDGDDDTAMFRVGWFALTRVEQDATTQEHPQTLDEFAADMFAPFTVTLNPPQLSLVVESQSTNGFASMIGDKHEIVLANGNTFAREPRLMKHADEESQSKRRLTSFGDIMANHDFDAACANSDSSFVACYVLHVDTEPLAEACVDIAKDFSHAWFNATVSDGPGIEDDDTELLSVALGYTEVDADDTHQEYIGVADFVDVGAVATLRFHKAGLDFNTSLSLYDNGNSITTSSADFYLGYSVLNPTELSQAVAAGADVVDIRVRSDMNVSTRSGYHTVPYWLGMDLITQQTTRLAVSQDRFSMSVANIFAKSELQYITSEEVWDLAEGTIGLDFSIPTAETGPYHLAFDVVAHNFTDLGDTYETVSLLTNGSLVILPSSVGLDGWLEILTSNQTDRLLISPFKLLSMDPSPSAGVPTLLHLNVSANEANNDNMEKLAEFFAGMDFETGDCELKAKITDAMAMGMRRVHRATSLSSSTVVQDMVMAMGVDSGKLRVEIDADEEEESFYSYLKGSAADYLEACEDCTWRDGSSSVEGASPYDDGDEQMAMMTGALSTHSGLLDTILLGLFSDSTSAAISRSFMLMDGNAVASKTTLVMTPDGSGGKSMDMKMGVSHPLIVDESASWDSSEMTVDMTANIGAGWASNMKLDLASYSAGAFGKDADMFRIRADAGMDLSDAAYADSAGAFVDINAEVYLFDEKNVPSSSATKESFLDVNWTAPADSEVHNATRAWTSGETAAALVGGIPAHGLAAAVMVLRGMPLGTCKTSSRMRLMDLASYPRSGVESTGHAVYTSAPGASEFYQVGLDGAINATMLYDNYDGIQVQYHTNTDSKPAMSEYHDVCAASGSLGIDLEIHTAHSHRDSIAATVQTELAHCFPTPSYVSAFDGGVNDNLRAAYASVQVSNAGSNTNFDSVRGVVGDIFDFNATLDISSTNISLVKTGAAAAVPRLNGVLTLANVAVLVATESEIWLGSNQNVGGIKTSHNVLFDAGSVVISANVSDLTAFMDDDLVVLQVPSVTYNGQRALTADAGLKVKCHQNCTCHPSCSTAQLLTPASFGSKHQYSAHGFEADWSMSLDIPTGFQITSALPVVWTPVTSSGSAGTTSLTVGGALDSVTPLLKVNNMTLNVDSTTTISPVAGATLSPAISVTGSNLFDFGTTNNIFFRPLVGSSVAIDVDATIGKRTDADGNYFLTALHGVSNGETGLNITGEHRFWPAGAGFNSQHMVATPDLSLDVKKFSVFTGAEVIGTDLAINVPSSGIVDSPLTARVYMAAPGGIVIAGAVDLAAMVMDLIINENFFYRDYTSIMDAYNKWDTSVAALEFAMPLASFDGNVTWDHDFTQINTEGGSGHNHLLGKAVVDVGGVEYVLGSQLDIESLSTGIEITAQAQSLGVLPIDGDLVTVLTAEGATVSGIAGVSVQHDILVTMTSSGVSVAEIHGNGTFTQYDDGADLAGGTMDYDVEVRNAPTDVDPHTAINLNGYDINAVEGFQVHGHLTAVNETGGSITDQTFDLLFCPPPPCLYKGGDTDGDEICDMDDTCPNDAANDADGDGLCYSADACPDDASNSCDAAAANGTTALPVNGNGTTTTALLSGASSPFTLSAATALAWLLALAISDRS